MAGEKGASPCTPALPRKAYPCYTCCLVCDLWLAGSPWIFQGHLIRVEVPRTVNLAFDSVLFVAFGGPTPGCCGRREPCPGNEATCFIQSIVGEHPAAQTRVAEVAAHYAELGGFSPFNDLTGQQVQGIA